MAHYFSYVSDFNYISLLPEAKISDYITVKNFFRRGQIAPQIFTNLAYFEDYTIEGDERADQVADKFYTDPTLDWIVFLSNNIINLQSEWPLPSYVFDKVMLEKYGSYDILYSGIHHYQTEEIKDSLGNVMLKSGIRVGSTWDTSGNFIKDGNDYYYEFFDRGLGYVVQTPRNEFVLAVTNYDYEMDEEDKKRNIYLLKPQYINILLDDINNIMKYKKSSQYESRTLKKGDNVRLYS